MEDYKTISAAASDSFVERRSRFIGTIRPVSTEEEATAFIAQMKEKYWDARHNVYAYILREGQAQRYSDDGEPQGTAGIPVLEVLRKEGLADVVVVVTRYFGGILLGAGGLVRAYSHGAKIAVDAAGIQVMNPCTVVELDVDYSMYGKVTYLLPRYYAVTQNADFGEIVKLQLLIKDEYLPAFEQELTELSGGTVFPHPLEHRWANIPEE